MDSTDAYETHALTFLRRRDSSTVGTQVINRWAQTLGRGAAVIELGCGGGYPVTRVLHEAGLRLYAVDSSPTLVAEFKLRFPDVPVLCEKVQKSRFFDKTYDAAIAIGLIFLLSESEQLALITSVSRILVPGGRFLFTAPVETGNWVDQNTGQVCKSLGRAVYETSLEAVGFHVVSTFADAGDNNHYDVERVR